MTNVARILVADDKRNDRMVINEILSKEGYTVREVENGKQALHEIGKKKFDLLILDLQMPELGGFDVLRNLSNRANSPKIIIVTGFPGIKGAVKATKMGAFDYVEKEALEDRLLVSVRNCLRQVELERMQRGQAVLLGESKPMRRLKELIGRAASADCTVLILGESGSGKELVAREIHQQSKRSSRQFSPVNCSAIPETLIESELFGHVKGAFTQAYSSQKGTFEAADGGTVFLDEIGDMSLATQAKVLRVLESGEIKKIGATQSAIVDVRVIAATNKALKSAVAEKQFREDLYYRLNVINLTVPSLRDRVGDIGRLASHFLELNSSTNNQNSKKLTKEAINELCRWPWAGNVRELRNLMDRIAVMSSSDVIDKWELLQWKETSSNAIKGIDYTTTTTYQQALQSFERQFLLNALENNSWNVSRTAKRIGLNRSYLHEKMKGLGIGRMD